MAAAVAGLETLEARIAGHPVNKQTHGKGLWAHILRDQLIVDEDTFWRCVRDGAVPQRSRPTPQRRGLPVDLARLVIEKVGLSETEVLAMSREAAIARAAEYWSTGR